jgi:DNA-binding GntR family transcriptional regulator
MRPFTDPMGLPLSTTSAEAAACYVTGAQLLVVACASRARPALEAALGADPTFSLAVAALAVCAFLEGSRDEALVILSRAQAPVQATRRERQHVEIVTDVLSGNGERARALGQDHLSEFPGDVLVAHLLRAEDRRG